MNETEHKGRDQQSDVCPNCGVHDNALKDYGPLHVIPDTSYTLLLDLFRKQVDDYRCPTCGQSIHLQPTVMISLNEGREYWCCFGDRPLAVSEEVGKVFADRLQAEGGRVEVFATLDELRAAYAIRIAFLMERINQGIKSMGAEPVAGSWRDFPSNHFVAAKLMLSSVPLPNIQINLPEHATWVEAIDSLATLQAWVWVSLCGSWSGKIEQGRTLEGELERYCVPEAVLQQAADKFLMATENPDHWSPMGHFCLEALRASLCTWLERPNPQVQEWADLFIEWEVARLVLGEQSPPYLVAMEISAKRAHGTIPYEELFNASARHLGTNGLKLEILERLQEIGKKVGYPYLAQQLAAGVRLGIGEKQGISIEQLIEVLRVTCEIDSSPDIVLNAASQLLVSLDTKCSPDVLDRIAKELEGILGKEDIEIRTGVKTWLCSHLMEDGLPQVVLEQIGDEPQSWERQLTLWRRADLWTERSNALRMCGRTEEALTIAEAVIADLKAADESIPLELRRNLGILYREAGRQEQALDIFLALLPEAHSDFRLRLLESIVATYSSLGNYAEALPYQEEAAWLAGGPDTRNRTAVLASLAAGKSTSAAGKRSEALSILRQIPVDETNDLEVMLPYASAWINLIQHPELLEDGDYERIGDLGVRLIDLHGTTLQNRNMKVHMHITRLLAIFLDLIAIFLDLTGFEDRNVFWELMNIGAREFEGAPDPLALAALARDAWAEGKIEEARSYLLEIPSAVAQRYAPEADISLKIQALDVLRLIFNILAELASHFGSFEDLRLVAELRRDMLGRIAASSMSYGKVPLAGFVAPDTQTIVHLGGPTAIFEWVDGNDDVIGLATFVALDGTVTEAYLNSPNIDLRQLARRVTQRLSLWHPGRIGDPLDLEEWQAFQNWLTEQLEGHLTDGGRLVVIEHSCVAGLQWHVAAAPRWRVSYAPSWSALLTPRQPMPVKAGPIGLAMVPKYREATNNLLALEGSVSHTLQLATDLDLQLNYALQENCDREALVEVLEGTTVAKVLCHGFVDPDKDVVALMVAYEGELPLSNSVAANTPSGRRHRFDWRDCQRLKKAPSVLLSAACNSGQSHHVGLGEQVGLFSTLRRAGTRSFVAPRWDIEPKVVLPILDNAIERYLRTDAELGEALHAACCEASERLPHWQAWALALEGDWK